MELRTLETLVRDGLAGLDLHVEGRMVDGVPTVGILDRAAEPPRVVAVITDHRTDHFSLRLDDGYTFHDTEWPESNQVELVGDFCRIVASYLLGEGTEGQSRPLWGLLGRVRPTYSVDLDGRTCPRDRR